MHIMPFAVWIVAPVAMPISWGVAASLHAKGVGEGEIRWW